jgi:hypothetical protein
LSAARALQSPCQQSESVCDGPGPGSSRVGTPWGPARVPKLRWQHGSLPCDHPDARRRWIGTRLALRSLPADQADGSGGRCIGSATAEGREAGRDTADLSAGKSCGVGAADSVLRLQSALASGSIRGTRWRRRRAESPPPSLSASPDPPLPAHTPSLTLRCIQRI